MNGKTGLLLITLASLLYAGHAMANTDTLPATATGIVPVLITLDENGQVAAIDTVDRMSPVMSAELRKHIVRIMSQPGFDQTVAVPGRQFVATLAPAVQQLADGNYAVDFSLVSSQSLANGRWTWQLDANQGVSLARGHVVTPGQAGRVSNWVRAEDRPPVYEPPLAPLGPTGTYVSR